MIDTNMIAERTASLLLKIKGITFRFNPPYTYTSGMKSPVYLDNRLVMSYPEVRKEIINSYIEVIKEQIGIDKVDYVSATATAAIPHGSWIADRLDIPMVFVRPTTKMHGKQSKIEGYLKKGSKVIIIEDHVSTAESVVGNVNSIREAGGEVEYCVATTTYETQKSKDALAQINIKLITLTTGKMMVEMAAKENYLTADQKKEVEAWFSDPIHWGEKFNT